MDDVHYGQDAVLAQQRDGFAGDPSWVSRLCIARKIPGRAPAEATRAFALPYRAAFATKAVAVSMNSPMKHIRPLLCTLLLLAFPATHLLAETLLVGNGQARAEIVIAEKPARMTKLAARE